MTTIEEILANSPTQYSNLSMGIRGDLFYYGKITEHKDNQIEMIVLSDKRVLANYSVFNTKTDKQPNEINDFGVYYKDVPINTENNDWTNESIQRFINSKERLVNKKEVYNKIKDRIAEFMEIYDPRITSMLSCWIIGTYLYDLFPCYGYILLTSQKASGKSKLLNIIGLLSRNSVSVSSPSESVLFRMINGNRITLLIDDFETFKNDERTNYLLQILKIGIDQEGGIPRNEKYKDTYIPKKFNCYCPKVITNTTSLDQVTISRCITINLLPTATDKGKIRPNKKDPLWQSIRDDCHILIMENFQEILEIYNTEDFGELNSRELDTTKGLLAVAKFLDDSVFQEVSEYLKESFCDRDLQDLSNDWEYLLFKQLSEKVTAPKWCSLEDMDRWLKELVQIDYNKKLNQYIGSVLSKLPSLFKKQRYNDGIKYLITPESVQQYMKLKKYPCALWGSQDSQDTLNFKDEPFRELNNEIMDTCVNCNQGVYVKYTSKVVKGRNICEACVRSEAKRKSDAIRDGCYGQISKTNLGE
jgi:hypothetical protein